MSLKSIVAGAAVAGIVFGLAATGEASAATTAPKKPVTHALVCKAGYTPHRVKVHGKWHWACEKVSHKTMTPAPKKPVAPKA
jgi:hypothetical protein